jgi:hypothetical protein
MQDPNPDPKLPSKSDPDPKKSFQIHDTAGNRMIFITLFDHRRPRRSLRRKRFKRKNLKLNRKRALVILVSWSGTNPASSQ